MKHVSPADLMDVVDRMAPADVLAHVETCEACRRRLADARLGVTLARRDQVPDLPPLEWSRLSVRVRRAVADEGRPGRGWLPVWWAYRPAGLALAAMLTIAVGAAVWTVQVPGARGANGAPGRTAAVAAGETSGHADTAASDEPWNLVSQFVEGLALEPGGADALSAPVGSAERAIPTLTESERGELARLLKERLGES